jgi:RHS repeat-associated protein
LREIVGTDTTDYLGNIIKKNGVLYQISHDEGRIINGEYEYNIKDHLGNLRVVFRDSLGIAKITQANSYGIWGEDLPTLSYSKQSWKADNFKFTGKESLQGTGFIDFGARWYDNIVPRFTTIDPLAEKYHHLSGYSYVANSPILLIDPSGASIKYNWGTGNYEEDGEVVGADFAMDRVKSGQEGDDVNIHGSDGKTLTVKAPGADVNINVDAKIGSNRTIDIGLKKIEDLAVGYQLSGTVGYQIGMGAYPGVNIAKVYFLNSEYGYYWYTYIGGEATTQVGFAADISASIIGNVFVMANVENGKDRFNPKNFIGEANAFGISGALKVLGGAGASISGFSSGPWRGINIGISASVGYGVNMGSIFHAESYTHIITPVIPTKQRSWSDIIINNLQR